MDLPENIDLEDEKGMEDEDQQDDTETGGECKPFFHSYYCRELGKTSNRYVAYRTQLVHA